MYIIAWFAAKFELTTVILVWNDSSAHSRRHDVQATCIGETNEPQLTSLFPTLVLISVKLITSLITRNGSWFVRRHYLELVFNWKLASSQFSQTTFNVILVKSLCSMPNGFCLISMKLSRLGSSPTWPPIITIFTQLTALFEPLECMPTFTQFIIYLLSFCLWFYTTIHQ